MIIAVLKVILIILKILIGILIAMITGLIVLLMAYYPLTRWAEKHRED